MKGKTKVKGKTKERNDEAWEKTNGTMLLGCGLLPKIGTTKVTEIPTSISHLEL